MIACMLSILLAFSCAQAEESVLAEIPVIANGADCTAVLVDADGNTVDSVELKDGVEGTLSVLCKGMFAFHYTVRLDNEDTETVQYDTTAYQVTITPYYGADDIVQYILTVGDTEPYKPEQLSFTNTVAQPEETTPSPEETTPPPEETTPPPEETTPPPEETTPPPEETTPPPEETTPPPEETTQPPEETVTPVPFVPGPSTAPYDQFFSFTKRWQGDHEDSIDWVMYNDDGSQRHKLFDKIIVSENEWRYEAWFQATEDIKGCYIVETPAKGYMVRYENVGAYASRTNGCYNGGTIINYKVPKTQDVDNPIFYMGLGLLGTAGIAAIILKRRRRKEA